MPAKVPEYDLPWRALPRYTCRYGARSPCLSRSHRLIERDMPSPGPGSKPSFPASPKGRALPVAPYRYQPMHLPLLCESKSTYARGPSLLDRVREAMRIRHYSRRTEQTYCAWIRRFILFRAWQ